MVCSTVVLHAKCSLQPVLCFYCAVGPTKAPRTPHASCGTGSVSLSLSLFPLLRTLLRPNAATAAAPHHEQRGLGLSVASPPSPIHGSEDSVPPLPPAPGLAEARHRGQGSPAWASPPGPGVPRSRTAIGDEVLHSHVVVTGNESSAWPPPHGRCPLLAHAGNGAFSRHRWRGSGSSSLHV
jgi:hypothetical protein